MHSDAAGVTSVARHSQADLTTACARHCLGPATGPVTRCEHVGMSRTTELVPQLEDVRSPVTGHGFTVNSASYMSW